MRNQGLFLLKIIQTLNINYNPIKKTASLTRAVFYFIKSKRLGTLRIDTSKISIIYCYY